MQIKTLALNGEAQKITDKSSTEYPGLVHEHSIAVGTSLRGDSTVQEIPLKDNSLVELVFEDGGKWLGPADMLEDLYPGSAKRNRSGEEVFEIQGDLEHPNATRGWDKIALQFVNIFTGKTVKKAADAAKQQVKELASRFEDQMLGTPKGLMSVRDNMALVKYEDVDITRPVLLLLHGTGSSTQGSFGELAGTPLWTYWQQTYGKNIVAFQHETFTKSPLQNVVDLLKQLPANATLHLISHSRGGLVGEVLCRFSQQDVGNINGFSDKDIQLFDKAAQPEDYKSIKALREIANIKQYKVDKFIRVACPAAGTTILSNRLDYFINILLNLLGVTSGLIVHPAYIALKELLVAVVDQKNQPDVLPGLEAMKPDSLFIRVLNSQAPSSIPIASPVAVIAGNSKVGLNLKSLIVIASKLFYWEDNDLIVNTKSMYAGSKKTNGLQYFFDEGTGVDHFHYFKNDKTNGAILLAFKATSTATIDGFTLFNDSKTGEIERNAVLGLSGVHFSMDAPSGKKPIVVLLPGIMGSGIEQDGDLIWVNLLKFVSGGLDKISIDTDASTIKIPGIISSSYKELARNLSSDYDVVTFAYDWRQSLVTAAKDFDAKINSLLPLKQPIKIIGHSMGGVLVRDFIIHHDDTWQKLNQSEGFQLIFLGAPLGGSHRILNVLFGQDSLIKKLAMVDLTHDLQELLGIFNRFPGILGLLPLTKAVDNSISDKDFGDSNLWKDMIDWQGIKNWPQPTAADLKVFSEYRDAVLKAQPNINYGKAVYVAGRDKHTPCGFRKDETVRGKELTFLSTAEGDQSVTWDSGIPTQMDKKNVYYVNVSHGNLANTSSMFAGIKELLAKGETNLFTRNRPVVRSSEKLFKQPEMADFDLSPRGVENTLLGISTNQSMTAGELPIKVKVSHGDLKFAEYPLLAGHFKNDSILYAEKKINELLNDLLAERHAVGLYPGEIGTSEILLTQQTDAFPGAIIAGLGEPGSLNSFFLSRTIEQAVARYLLIVNGREKINNPMPHKTPLGVSSLIIGCGYGGLSIENSITAILEGILLANAKIKNLYQENAKLIEQVQFIELYEDRLLACYYTIHNLCNQEGGLLNITKEREGVEPLPGGRKRISLLQVEEWWNRIEVRKVLNTKGAAKGMNFLLGGNSARQDQQDVYTATGIVEKLSRVISTEFNWDIPKARALYELLVPHEFKDEVKKYGNIVWVLDEYTAGFPWELLHDKSAGAKPLCIDSGMIRQLIVQNGREKIDMANSKTALVVGDPNLKGSSLPQLPGALEEAKMVAGLLEENGYTLKPRALLRSTPEEIIPALFSADYKIIHLAGHGEFSEDPDKESGMVIGNGAFLTTAEIKQMSSTSELVFVNCCYLGHVDDKAETQYQQRYKLAANIGTQLISNGVKAVVVAGWAVEDTAALDFAKFFYKNMFDGFPFGEAVRLARKEVYSRHADTNTWGAYQCYGDPYYRLVNDRDKRSGTKHGYVLSEQAEIDLYNLLSDLACTDVGEDRKWAEDRLKQISKEVDDCKIRNQAITEREAFVFMELDIADKAIEKFEQLQAFKNASYSFEAIEQYYYLRAKKLYKSGGTHQLSPAELEEAFGSVLKGLTALVDIKPTANRYNLMGSAYKKKMSLYSAPAKKIKEIKAAAEQYRLAYQNSTDMEAAYPFANWVYLQCLLINADPKQWEVNKTKYAKDSRDNKMPDSMDAIRQRLDFFDKQADGLKKSGEYFDVVRKANIAFGYWLLQFADKKAEPISIKSVVDLYRDAWEKAATESEKADEIIHLNLLLNGASIGKTKTMAKALGDLIKQLG